MEARIDKLGAVAVVACNWLPDHVSRDSGVTPTKEPAQPRLQVMMVEIISMAKFTGQE